MKKSLFIALIILSTGCKKGAELPTPIVPPQVSSITFDNVESSIVLGDTKQLNVSYAPKNANKPEYEWTSSNQDVLSVSPEGKISAKLIGSASIAVKVKNTNIFIEQKITVVPGIITSLTLDKTQLRLIVNQQEKISASILPLTASTATVNWISSAPLIAQVSSTGLVTALSAGNAVITATSSDGKVNAKSNIEVIEEIKYTRNVFDRIKTDLLDQLLLYNEQQGKKLGTELQAARIGYIVLASSATETSNLTSNPGYPEAAFSRLQIPTGNILKVLSNFYLELFPNTSKIGLLTIEFNFFEKTWEVRTNGKTYLYKYTDKVTLDDLKAIVDLNVSNVRKYVTE